MGIEHWGWEDIWSGEVWNPAHGDFLYHILFPEMGPSCSQRLIWGMDSHHDQKTFTALPLFVARRLILFPVRYWKTALEFPPPFLKVFVFSRGSCPPDFLWNVSSRVLFSLLDFSASVSFLNFTRNYNRVLTLSRRGLLPFWSECWLPVVESWDCIRLFGIHVTLLTPIPGGVNQMTLFWIHSIVMYFFSIY